MMVDGLTRRQIAERLGAEPSSAKFARMREAARVFGGNRPIGTARDQAGMGAA
jgi:hypothetical protein